MQAKLNIITDPVNQKEEVQITCGACGVSIVHLKSICSAAYMSINELMIELYDHRRRGCLKCIRSERP